MPSQLQSLYTGRSGHLAVMAEFLHRGYNAAIPEVERGDDIFVVQDDNGDLSRIQVKAANGKGRKRWYAQYAIPVGQLKRVQVPDLWYVFAIWHEDRWRDFLVIARADLNNYQAAVGLGPEQNGKLLLRLSYGPGDVRCAGLDLQPFRNNWTKWPIIAH
jgi:hypothetical protein